MGFESKEIEIFSPKCDSCDWVEDLYDEFLDDFNAEAWALNNNWITLNGMLLCPECWTLDQYDEPCFIQAERHESVDYGFIRKFNQSQCQFMHSETFRLL